MGSCISKFGPNRKRNKKECCQNCSQFHVHDKVVIAQASVSSAPQKRVSPLPSNPPSNASFSLFSNPTSAEFSVTSSLSSSSSCSSSLSLVKDRSFSTDFLRNCVKENPHVIGQKLVNTSLQTSRIPAKINSQNFGLKPSPEKPAKDAIEERRGGSTPKKRIRANSPTIIRQKSFRKEPDRDNSMYHAPSRTLRSPSPNRVFNAEPSRTLRSPSPSRRFSGDQKVKDSYMMTKMENYSKRGVISKPSLLNPQASSLRKQSFRGSPVNQMHHLKKSYRDTPTSNPKVSTRMDECEVREEVNINQDVEMMLEDLDNPQIALDCFIFL